MQRICEVSGLRFYILHFSGFAIALKNRPSAEGLCKLSMYNASYPRELKNEVVRTIIAITTSIMTAYHQPFADRCDADALSLGS